MSVRNLCLTAAATVVLAAGLPLAPADADAAPSLPVFTPHPSDWSPDYVTFPYNLWQNRVTPEQVIAETETWIEAEMRRIFPHHYVRGEGALPYSLEAR